MTTRITQSMTARSMLVGINDVAQRLAATQQKMASGKEITRPSDDPYATARALSLASEVDGHRQYQRNVTEAVSWQSVTDTALGKMTDVVQRARELLIAGGSDTSGQTARTALADEVDQLIDALKQESATSYGGRFVFAGTQTATRPYTTGGPDTYAGDAGTVAREIGPGVSVGVNVLGSTLLGNGQGANDGLLLDNLRDIAQHLRGGTPADADALRTTDLQALDANLDNLSRARAGVGATTNRLEAAGARLAQLEESTTKLLSDVEDADMAKTLVAFSTQQAVYQAALRAGANIVQASLLDFLR